MAKQEKRTRGRHGRVVETVGRRVRVRDAEGDRVCFLSGQRAVLGDEVLWEEAPGTGGKLVEVLPRRTALRRLEQNGREQVLAANLGGLCVVMAGSEPPYRPGLVDRYLVAARLEGLDVVLALTKTDQGVPPEVEEDLAWRQEHLDLRVVRTSAVDGSGLKALTDALREEGPGPWALVGHSGVGKTSLIGALLPDVDVGPVGELSSYWGTGQHTTTSSTLYALDEGLEIVDSPGIRTFLPDVLEPTAVRDHFPGVGRLGCRYRACLHREVDDGCVAVEEVEPRVLTSYRRLLAEVTGVQSRQRR